MAEMYNVRPFYDFSNVKISSNVMYTMPPMQKPPIMQDSVNPALTTDKISTDLIQLKEQQDHLLDLLDSFIEQSLSSNQGFSTATSSSPLDLVIRVNPKKPPNSLKFFQKLLKRKFRVLWKSHVHSSVSYTFDQAALPAGENSVSRSEYDVIITVIYTEDVDDPVALIDPSSSVPIVGETNIARLFGRLLGVYDCGANTSAFTDRCDVCFDACDVINKSPSNEKRASIQKLERMLQQNEWLCGNSASFVDAVANSALRKCEVQSSVLRSWLTRVPAS